VARFLPALGPALLLLALAGLLFEAWPVPPQTDDAYISYRYARNLVGGLGLVYNAGEYVEGITNFLWTLLVAGGLALGFEAKGVGHALGVASAATALCVTYAYAGMRLPPSRSGAAGVAAWVVLASLPFVYWTTSGMETSLFAALVAATLAAEARERRGWAVAAAFLAFAVRPDGVLVAAAALGWRVLSRGREEGLRVLRGPLVYVLLVAVLRGFRLP